MMPWWVPLYVLLILGGAVLGVFVERERRPLKLVLLDLFVSPMLVLFVLAYYARGLLDHLGRPLAVLFVLMVVGLGLSHQWEMKALRDMPELRNRPHGLGLTLAELFSVALYVPGLGLGALVVARAW